MGYEDMQAAYEATLQRADEHGVEVVAFGTGTDGREYWFVPSVSDPGADWHRVWVADGHFQCTCPAGQHGKLCVHKAVSRRAKLESQHQLVRAEHQVHEPEHRIFTVEYEAKPGRATTCSKCGAAFVEHELITLRDKTRKIAWCSGCSAGPRTAGDTALLRRNDQPFDLMK